MRRSLTEPPARWIAATASRWLQVKDAGFAQSESQPTAEATGFQPAWFRSNS
jgi:hypothetical protein